MANIISPKRTSTAGKVPTTSDLASGEIAVNMADKKVYINYSGTIVQIGAGFLSGLGDVALSTLVAGQTLSWNGTAWTNSSAGAGDVVGPSSATDNALARFDTTTGKLIQNSVVTVDDSGNMAGIATITNINYVDFNTGYVTTLAEGQLGWDGNNTLGLGMIGGNVIQHIGEDQFFYCKASSAITKGQVVMFTGAVGASGVPTGAPATGITDGTYIMGIAAENIALNGFGLVQSFGTLKNVNTSGYADGDILWYDPSVTGGLTKTKPSAPNVKAQMAAVINGGSSGGGTILIRINAGSTLGGTDSNAQINGASNGQFITYDGLNGYWKNTTISAGTAISVSSSSTGVLTITNTAPDQTVTLTGAGTTTITGTYPNFTITSNDQYSGTVTSVAMTVPTGLSISGSPITTSGTLALTLTTGYSIPTTASQTNWDSAYTQRLQWDGGSTNLVAATGRTSLGATTLGSNIFTITNPSAVTFPRFNADNTVSALSAANMLTALGGTTVGQNFFDLTNPSAITFPRINADNTVSALDAATFRTAIGAGTSSTTGTVTSVGGTGTVSGLTLTGTVTSSGNLTLGGNLTIAGEMIYDTFTATASQTTFTPSTTYTSGKIEVYVNGVKMRNGTDVTVTSGTSVVFATGLAVGSLVDLVYPT